MAGPGHAFLGVEEAALVQEVLADWELSRYRFDAPDGPPSKVYLFEREAERRFAVRHCLAVNSGTSALLAALVALGIGPGDEVIVPGYTFIASIAAIVHRGAVPVLAEIDDTLTLDVADVARRIGSSTRAILAVHMLGAPCALPELRALADAHELYLVEDVAQACGGRHSGRHLGAFGDAAAFSLNTFKIITAGDGGFLTCTDDDVYERAFAFHDHGFAPLRQGLTEWDGLFGLNLRMHELCGAIALGQLRKLDAILDCLHHQHDLFRSVIGDLPGVRLRPSHDPEGDCRSTLTLQFDDPARAARVATALGTRPLIESGRHYYGNMPQLLARRAPTRAACPFECAAYPTTQEYREGMLPCTDDILARSVALSVGVRDKYLGAGFGIEPLTPLPAVEAVGRQIADAVRAADGPQARYA